MSSYKEPSFQERTALANKARQTALEQLRAKPAIDEAVITERREAAQARDQSQAKVRDEKNAARKLEKALKRKRVDQKALDASAPILTEEDRKTIRDAKYAARKSSKGKR